MLYTLKAWILVALLAGVAATSAIGAWTVKSYQCEAKVSKLEADFERAKATISEERLANERRVRAQESSAAEAVRKVSDAYNAREKKLRASNAAARTGLDSLRDEARITIPAAPFADNPSPPAGVDGATVARAVVGECAAAIHQVAQAADDAESRLSALQEYVAKVLGVFRAAPNGNTL